MYFYAESLHFKIIGCTFAKQHAGSPVRGEGSGLQGTETLCLAEGQGVDFLSGVLLKF